MRSSYLFFFLNLFCLLCLFSNPLLAEDSPVDLLDKQTEEVKTTTTVRDEPTTTVGDKATTKKYTASPDAPDGLTTQQYVDYYLKQNNGNAEAAWGHAYRDRLNEGEAFQNLQRRDAEHYLWSLQDVNGNSYQWLPSMIRTTGYSVVKIGQYWGTEGVNSVRGVFGADEVKNTTRPTMDEFVWGIKGSHHALFGMD